jgi:hypothetical protein
VVGPEQEDEQRLRASASERRSLPRPTSPKSRSATVHPPDIGDPSLLLLASVLLFSGGVVLFAVVKRSL